MPLVIVRSATPSQINSFLTQASASVNYLSRASASSIYLTQDSASNIYLTQESALSNYLPQSSASSTYLTQSNAALTYLSQSSASTTYLRESSASGTYLTQASASTTYLPQTSASSTYLSQANAALTYLTQSSASTSYLTQASASTSYLTQASASTNYAPRINPVFPSDIQVDGQINLLLNQSSPSTYINGFTVNGAEFLRVQSGGAIDLDSKSITLAATSAGIGMSGTISHNSGNFNTSGNINTSGIIQQGGNAIVQIISLGTPVIHEVSFTGTVNTSLSLNTTIPLDARFILADVFVTAGISDHQNFEMGNVAPGVVKNWVDTRGSQPSLQFGNLQRQTVIMTYTGEVDGYSPNYGMWYSSQIIPITNRTLYYGNYGNSGSNGWIYWRIRGYSK